MTDNTLDTQLNEITATGANTPGIADHKANGKLEPDDVISGAEAEGLVLWLKASLVRAVKTAAQSAVAAIGTTVLTIGQVDWRIIGGTAALSAVLSLLTSVAGIPEVDDGANVAKIAAKNYPPQSNKQSAPSDRRQLHELDCGRTGPIFCVAKSLYIMV